MGPPLLSSLDHESPLDTTKHATGVLEDDKGRVLGKIHIASDPRDQQVGYSVSLAPSIVYSQCALAKDITSLLRPRTRTLKNAFRSPLYFLYYMNG